MEEYLFVYGTLQREDLQLKLYGRILDAVPDFLPCYSLQRIQITDEKFLSTGENEWQNTIRQTNDVNDTVPGTLLTLTADELNITDSYEPANYRRVMVKLKSGKNAWLYITD